MGRLELKLLVLLVLLTGVPLIISFTLSRTLFERSLMVGLGPEVTTALHDAVELHGRYVRAEKDRQTALARGLADSRALAAAAPDPEALRALLRAAVATPRVAAIELRGPDGPALRVKNPAITEPGWRLRTLELPLDGVPGYATLRYTFGLEAAFLDRFERMEADVIAPRAALETYRDDLADDLSLRFLIPLATAIFLAAIISLVVGRRVTRRLDALRRAMDRVAAGELEVQVAPTGRDEVAELAERFNEMTRRLRDSRARIEHLTRVSAFQGIARRLAHEIKNPLTPILLAVQQVHRSYRGDDPRYRRVLDTAAEVVEQEVATLKRLVENFSRFARLPPAEPAAADLAAFARELVAAHPEIDGLTAIAPDTPVIAAVDKGLLRQALTNLLKNAHEALRERDPRDFEAAPRVHLRVEELDDAVRLVVEDNGPGVAPGDRERIFEPYVTGKEDGTGLGLAIVKKIVLDHDGTIAATDSADGGARFEIVLPRAQRGASA
ncbi:MAG: ATP-binding protein [bacterium]